MYASTAEDLVNEITNIENHLARIVESVRTNIRDVCYVEIKKGLMRKEVVKGISASYDVAWRICDILHKIGFEEYRKCEVCYTPKGVIIELSEMGVSIVLTLSDFIMIVKEALELENSVYNTLKNEVQQLMQTLQPMQNQNEEKRKP